MYRQAATSSVDFEAFAQVVFPIVCPSEYDDDDAAVAVAECDEDIAEDCNTEQCCRREAEESPWLS